MTRFGPLVFVGRIRLVLVLAAGGMLLAACQTTLTGSVAGSECKVFERPTYAVRGLRSYDQDWIDSQVEGGVGACGWQRPEPRPASIDAAGAVPQPVGKPVPAKRSLLSRVKAKLTRKPSPPSPIAPAPPAEPATVVEEPPAPPPPPPDPVDQLLDRSGPAIGKFQDRAQ